MNLALNNTPNPVNKHRKKDWKKRFRETKNILLNKYETGIKWESHEAIDILLSIQS